MADSDPGERSYDNMLKMLSDLNKDLEKLLEEMEKISGRMSSQAEYLPSFQWLHWSRKHLSLYKVLSLTRVLLTSFQLLQLVTIATQQLTDTMLFCDYLPHLASTFGLLPS
jgi:hypothetical protein